MIPSFYNKTYHKDFKLINNNLNEKKNKQVMSNL